MFSRIHRPIWSLLAICVLTVLAASGAFATITSPLTHYSANPHYFSSNGTPVVLLGAHQPLPADKSGSYTSDLDDAASHGINYVRLWNIAVWDGSNEYYPWARTGGGSTQDGGGAKFDLTQWDSNYWSKLKGCISYAQSKNIYVSVILFDRCGMDVPDGSHRWDWNPWNPLNNINGLSLPTSGAGIPAFYDLTNTKLISLQEQYAAKLIQETSSYPNVIYEVCNEYTGTWPWEQHWVDYFKARCSNMISVNHLGQTSSTPSSVWSYAGVDLVKLHWLTTSASTTNSDMTGCYSHNKATDYDETPEVSGLSATNCRNMLWGSFVGGGHCHIEDGPNPSAAASTVMYCRNFINKTGLQFWNMSPNNSLVTSTPGGSAFCLANPGSEYLVYISGSGSGSLKMNLTTGLTYTAQAYNPSNGTYTNLTVSGNTISGIPSYSSDIVVYVKAGTPPAASNPSITLTLAANKSTAIPGDVITYTLTYKNGGSGSASNVVITNNVPASTTFVTGSASSGGVYSGGNVSWTLSSLAAGASGTLSFQAKVN